MKFELTEKQVKKYNKWYKKLPKVYTDAINTRIAFTFISTGLGCIIKVKDLATKKELDLTDWENW